MIYVGEEGNIVYDGTTLTEEEKSNMIAIESLPEPNTPDGKVALIRADLETQTVYYEYVDKPKNDELEELKTRLEATEQTLIQIMMEGMM